MLRAGIACVASLFLCACATRQAGPSDPRGAQAEVGLYRATLDREGLQAESFKLLLWAARPDHLHGEVVGPMGRTFLIFDGGNGRIAVTFVRDRLSYSGEAGAQGLEKLVGIAVPLEELVGALLGAPIANDTLEVDREPDVEGLPERLVVEHGGRSLRLALKRFRPLKGPAAALGTGEPPPGMEVLPIELLEPVTYADETGREAP